MTRMTVCLLAVLSLHSAPLDSQEIAIDSGRLVRVTLRDRPQVTGILLRSWSREQPALFVCRTMPNGCESVNDTAARWIDSAAIRQVARQQGTQWRQGALTGAVVGTLLGTVVMGLANSMDCDHCNPPRNTWLAIPAGTIAFGLVGAGLGASHPRWASLQVR